MNCDASENEYDSNHIVSLLYFKSVGLCMLVPNVTRTSKKIIPLAWQCPNLAECYLSPREAELLC